MFKRRSKYLRLRFVRSYRDVPAPRKNEVVVATIEDRLLDEGMPYLNRGNRAPWWSSLPNNQDSYRRCHGINDLMSYGITIPAWCDFEAKVTGGRMSIQPSDHQFVIEGFSFSQVGHCPITAHREIPEMTFPKLVAPFYFRTPPGWSLMTFQHPLFYSDTFSIMPGMIHSDFYHDMNIVLNIFAARDFIIPAGQPLLYCLPVRRASLGQVTRVSAAGADVASVFANYGLGYSGIIRSRFSRKGIYRQKLRDADS